MKVKIDITVEVDEESWALNYGTYGAAEVREDVRAYVRNALASAPVPMVATR